MSNQTFLSQFTYMKTGGPADDVITVNTIADMQQAVSDCKRNNKRFFILGGGSNTLFSDLGFRGTIILNRMRSVDIDTKSGQIRAESGVPMNMLVNQTAAKGLSGVEWYLGLPGTLGGAIYNNSHFKDHLIGDVIESVDVLDESNQIVTLPKSTLELAYDSSRFHHTKEIILSATLQLIFDHPQAVMSRAEASLTFRSTHQPLSFPSSGSFFQNPPGQLPAGALIDQAGLKNTQVGGAMVSPIHANFIVNTGKATSADVQQLAAKVESSVFQKFGIKLQKEVFVINELGERI